MTPPVFTAPCGGHTRYLTDDTHLCLECVRHQVAESDTLGGPWWALCLECTHEYGSPQPSRPAALAFYATHPVCAECQQGDPP